MVPGLSAIQTHRSTACRTPAPRPDAFALYRHLEDVRVLPGAHRPGRLRVHRVGHQSRAARSRSGHRNRGRRRNVEPRVWCLRDGIRAAPLSTPADAMAIDRGHVCARFRSVGRHRSVESLAPGRDDDVDLFCVEPRADVDAVERPAVRRILPLLRDDGIRQHQRGTGDQRRHDPAHDRRRTRMGHVCRADSRSRRVRGCRHVAVSRVRASRGRRDVCNMRRRVVALAARGRVAVRSAADARARGPVQRDDRAGIFPALVSVLRGRREDSGQRPSGPVPGVDASCRRAWLRPAGNAFPDTVGCLTAKHGNCPD